MNPATTTTTALQQDTCASTQNLVTQTRQQRYQAKQKAARLRRRQEWERRKFAYQSLDFDGRVRFVPASGVPRLGEMTLNNFM